jgi:AcrR family transcriptional regulator
MILTDSVNDRRNTLNDKFYNLPIEKQNAIINAGYRVFSENSYKKSPMSEIAKEAGISKSLLFYYFKNKKELYLFLYNYVFILMNKIAAEEIDPSNTDFFELLLQSSKYKRKLIRQQMYAYRFMMKTFYEDEEVARDLIGKNSDATDNSINILLGRIDKTKFKDGVDIEQLISIIGWCAEGFWKEKFCIPNLDMDEIDSGFEKIIDFFRKNTYKGEYLL